MCNEREFTLVESKPKQYFFLPFFIEEVVASLRLPKEIKAKSEKEALIEAESLGEGLLCEVIKKF